MTIAPLERCCDVSPSDGNSLYAGSEQFFSSDSDWSRDLIGYEFSRIVEKSNFNSDKSTISLNISNDYLWFFQSKTVYYFKLILFNLFKLTLLFILLIKSCLFFIIWKTIKIGWNWFIADSSKWDEISVGADAVQVVAVAADEAEWHKHR